MQKVYVAETPYHLLICITKTILEKRINKDVVFVCRWIITPSIDDNLHRIFKDVVYFGGKKTIVDLLRLKIYLLQLPFLSNWAKKKIKQEENWFNKRDIFLFNDNNYYGCLLNSLRIYYNLIEDGLNCYSMKRDIFLIEMKKRSKTFRLLKFSWESFGLSKYTKSIEVNDASKILIDHPNIIERSREKMFRTLNDSEIDTIAKIFNYQPLNIPSLHEASLLLTQPLSEDQLISHEKKIKIFKYLVDKYSIGTLYIKVHPRDKDDYSIIFPNAIVLGMSEIPFEVYLLKERLHFRRAISAFTTLMDAVFCADEKIQLGMDWVLNFK